ncbi:hypothetical protein FDUTEX481_05663 [Tolypothrix sp. PCC 7601]|nr:hypothetical protein FDUTEX481_05663 [Tolypothrix sp. PCC 7601]
MGRASCPPHKLGGQDVHPTINTGIFFYLEVPYTILKKERDRWVGCVTTHPTAI